MNAEFLSNLNWLHILVATVAYFMLGAVWYSFLFQKKWIEYQGIDMNNPNAKKGVGGIMAFTFILEFLVTIGIAILIYRLGLSGLMSGIKLGLFTGILFSGIAIAISYLYQMKPTSLSMIDGGYHTVGQIIAAVILCMWQ